MANITDIVANNLRVLRKEKGLKQDEVAKQLFIKQSTLSTYERGDRSVPLDTMVTFAKYYGVSIDYLMGLSPVRSPKAEKQFIGLYTGLCDDAIDYLHFWSENKKDGDSFFPIDRIDLINAIFDSNNDIQRTFDSLLSQICEYLMVCARIFPYEEDELLKNIDSEYPLFCKMEFENLLTEIDVYKHKIAKAIDELIEELKFSIVFDYNECKYIDLHNAIMKDEYNFASINEVIKHNKALFEKYQVEIWRNHNYEDAQIMLYEKKIKRLKEIKQSTDLLKSQKDGEDNGKQENT